MRKYTQVLAVSFAGMLLGAACGGGNSAADDELIEAIKVDWINDGDFPEDLDINCVAGAFVSGVGGAEGAATYGIDASNVADSEFGDTPITEEHARAAAKGMLECDNFERDMLANFGGEATEDQAQCLADKIDDKYLEALFASTFMGEEGRELEQEFENDFEEALFTAISDCGIEG